MGIKQKRGNGGPPGPKAKKVIIKAGSKRQVRRYLKNPRSNRSAVIYFTEKDQRPFILSPGGGGISASGEFKLTKKWKLSKEKLDRIFIIASEADTADDGDEGPDDE